MFAFNPLLALLIVSLTNIPFILCQTASNSSWPYETFKTGPWQPPQLQINQSQATPGGKSEYYIFYSPLGPAEHQPAPLIVDNDGGLVWSGLPNSSFFNFGPYQYQGKLVLAYWNGTRYPEPIGRGSGTVHLLDNNYQEIAVVSLSGTFLTLNGTSNASNIDLHEIYITEQNTLIVTANNVTQRDLSSVGGPNPGWIVDCLVYEIDIATNRVLTEWKSLDHLDQLPLSLSLYTLGSEGYDGSVQSKAWGYFHINAVSPYRGTEGYLVSSRYFCSAIAISRADGSVIWRLQGRNGGDFHLDQDASFCYQHDVRVYSDDASDHLETMTMHDNENSPIDANKTVTSGLILQLDQQARTVSLVKRFADPLNPLYVTAQGSFQIVNTSPPSVFLGYGYVPEMAEFDYESGAVLNTYAFGKGQGKELSYRAFRSPWIGCPLTAPALVAERDGTEINVFVSWNGATEVGEWTVYGGSDPSQLSVQTTVPKAGFETQITLTAVKSAGIRYVQVSASLYQPWRKGDPETCGCYSQTNLSSAVVAV